MTEFRTERDSMGEVQVPAQAYYGAQTQRAVENFPISGWQLPPDLIHALGLVKYACGVANRDLGKLTGSGKNPLKRVRRDSEEVKTAKGDKQRRLHKAFLRYHDPANWPLLREALKAMGRADLIGNGKRHLIPTFQPKGTCQQPEGRRADPARPGARPKSTGLAVGARARSHGGRQPRTGGPRGKR